MKLEVVNLWILHVRTPGHEGHNSKSFDGLKKGDVFIKGVSRKATHSPLRINNFMKIKYRIPLISLHP